MKVGRRIMISAEPGLRCLNAGETLHRSTQLSALNVPRMIYFQFASFTEFSHINEIFSQLVHDPVLTRQEWDRGIFSCRIVA